MHTTEIEGWLFHHNGDYSGDVIIASPDAKYQVEVPFSALKGFMAEYFRTRITSALENMDGNELLDRLTAPQSDTDGRT